MSVTFVKEGGEIGGGGGSSSSSSGDVGCLERCRRRLLHRASMLDSEWEP